MPAANNYLEMLLYRLVPGRGEEFHAAFEQSSLELMERLGLTVVGYGPSQHDGDCYYLMRAYPSLEYRDQLLERCARDREWQQEYAARLAPVIASCITVIVPCEHEGIEKLKHTIAF